MEVAGMQDFQEMFCFKLAAVLVANAGRHSERRHPERGVRLPRQLERGNRTDGPRVPAAAAAW